MISDEYSSFKKIKNPSADDYRRLLDFTGRVITNLKKERKLCASMNKKRNALANKVRELDN